MAHEICHLTVVIPLTLGTSLLRGCTKAAAPQGPESSLLSPSNTLAPATPQITVVPAAPPPQSRPASPLLSFFPPLFTAIRPHAIPGPTTSPTPRPSSLGPGPTTSPQLTPQLTHLNSTHLTLPYLTSPHPSPYLTSPHLTPPGRRQLDAHVGAR